MNNIAYSYMMMCRPMTMRTDFCANLPVPTVI